MTAATLTAWTPKVPGIREVLHGSFPGRSHAYPMHVHSTWTLLMVDSGSVRYQLHNSEHIAAGAQVTLLPPFIPHDGCAAGPGGFEKRVVYLEGDLLDRKLVNAAVLDPARTSSRLCESVDALHRSLVLEPGPISSEVALETVLSLLRGEWVGTSDDATRRDPLSFSKKAVKQLQAMLEADMDGSLSLHDAAESLGCSRSALVHSFTRHLGMPPHRYQISRRLDRARTLLLEGHPAAEVAVMAGFHDQAHLTRHFKNLLGVPPGVWAASRGRNLEA